MNDLSHMHAAANWLQRLQTAPPDEQTLREWDEWCRASPANLEMFEKLQAVWDACDLPAVRESLPRPFGKRAGVRDTTFNVSIALAATLLLLIGAVVWWRMSVSHTGQVRTLTTAVAEHGSQVLADGSRVDLGARTRIVTRYTALERSITVESGEAFFQVQKDVHRPFVVNAGNVRITAVGTAFSVRRGADRTTVTVSEGVVRVAPDAAETPSHEVRARAGEQVAFTESSSNLTIARVGPGVATAWREGVLKFVDEPLAAVVENVNRYTPRLIVIDDPRLGERVFTGTVYEDRIEDWLQALERVFPLDVVEKEGAATRLVSREAAASEQN